jgi:glycosyltransferase involved in cell wall biosynthesis
MTVKFSVLLSLHIKEKPECLETALQSVFEQTYPPTEVVLVLDGKITEELQLIIDNFKMQYPEILKVIPLKKNAGLSIALNEGLKYCSSDLIARMDTDDICLSDRFLRQVTFMEENKNVDICGTWCIEIDADGNEFHKKKMPITHEECYRFTHKRDCLIHPSVMFRRSFFEKAGLYPEETYFEQDTIMWARGFKCGCIFANLPEYLLKFRIGRDFFVRRRGWKRAKSVFLARQQVNDILGFGMKAKIYTYLFAMTKLMPKQILAFLYKHAR